MKLFLKKVFLFSLPLLVVYAVVFCIVILTNGKQCKKLPVAGNVTTVILGDSHTECALNDSLLPATRNMSVSSETYFFSHAKLRYLFKKHPEVQTVILGVSYHNMSDYINDATYGNRSSIFLCRYFPVMNVGDKLTLLRFNPDIVADKQFILTGLKNFYNCEKYGSVDFVGSFSNVATPKTLNADDIEKRISSQFYHGVMEHDIAKFNLEYLEDIVELCAANDKKLIFVSTPVHEQYRKKIPVKFIEQYRAVASKYKQHLTVIDLNDVIQLDEKFYLPDGDHVTLEGAEQVTLKFKEALQTGKPVM